MGGVHGGRAEDGHPVLGVQAPLLLICFSCISSFFAGARRGAGGGGGGGEGGGGGCGGGGGESRLIWLCFPL